MGLILLCMVSISLSFFGGKPVLAEMHHVVGDDRGWEPSTDVAAWSSDRIFRVGDKLWFAYSAGDGSIAELKSREEYESCDATNPIKLLTDGLNSVFLDGEGIRYFISTKDESCKKGLKLNVEVLPQDYKSSQIVSKTEAAPPVSPTPSASVRDGFSFSMLLFGFWLCYQIVMNAA